MQMMSRQDRIRGCLEKHPDWSNARVAATSRGQITEVLEMRQKIGEKNLSPKDALLGDKIRACVAKHPEWPEARVANSVKCKISDIFEMRTREGQAENVIPMGQGPAATISVGEFLKRMDYDKMLAEAIKKHCRTKFVVESQMRTLSGILPSLWRSVADLERFENNRVYDSGKTWWSTEENVKQVQAKKKYWGIAR